MDVLPKSMTIYGKRSSRKAAIGKSAKTCKYRSGGAYSKMNNLNIQEPVMALYIRDSEVDKLAVKLQELTQALTKTEAVRTALTNEIERSRDDVPLKDRLQ